MRCLIFTGGVMFDEAWHKKQIRTNDYLIAADKGAEHLLTLGYVPDIVVGDLDSISDTAKEELIAQGVRFEISPREKNETDTELALIFALDLKPREIILFAASGDRLDHLLANVFLLAGYLNRGIPIYLQTPVETLWLTDKSATLTGSAGRLASLMAISPRVENLSLTGFYYSLQNATLYFGSSLGISNILQGKEAKIEFSRGILLISQQIK